MVQRYDDIVAELSKPEVASDPESFSGSARSIRPAGSGGALPNWASKRPGRETRLLRARRAHERCSTHPRGLPAGARPRPDRERDPRGAAPQDPNDDRSVVKEIRAGGRRVSGPVPGISSYVRALRREEPRKVDVVSANETGIGRLQEIVFEVQAPRLQPLKYESAPSVQRPRDRGQRAHPHLHPASS